MTNIIELWNKKFYTCSPTARKKRLEICSGCDEYNKFIKQCKICGCFMPAKVILGKSICPKNKWGEEPEGNHPIVELEKKKFVG